MSSVNLHNITQCEVDLSHPLIKGVQGRRPLPEREVSSHVFLLHGGPQARQKKYEWISVGKLASSFMMDYNGTILFPGCFRGIDLINDHDDQRTERQRNPGP